MSELPRTRQTSMTRPHEIALFIDCACNRLRDESKKPDTAGTWQQKTNPMIKGAGSHALQESANRIVGRSAQITDGRYADSNATPPGWLNPINIKTTDIALSVDSKFRNDYGGTTSSDWSIDLPITLNKVTTMRVASLEMPMSYYGVSMTAGNSTFLAVSCGPVGNSRLITEFDELLSTIYITLSTGPVKTEIDFNLYDLTNPSHPIAIQPWNMTGNGLFDDDALAWLVILPDGNYEIGWQDLNCAEDIVKGMASALQVAIPGRYSCKTGQFRAFFTLPQWLEVIQYAIGHTFLDAYNLNSSTVEVKASDNLKGMLLSSYLSYDVNRSDGKSIFANTLDNTRGKVSIAPAETESATTIEVTSSQRLNLHFAVDRGGNRDLVGSLQHKLGWMLGYRVGSYYTSECGRDDVPLHKLPLLRPVDEALPPSGIEPARHYRGNGAPTGRGAMSYISESVCNMEGPKYLYLCITDGTNNHGSSLVGCFAESTFNKDIMLRINLAASTYGVKIYRYFSLAGVASGWWRSRSYYGPVTIKRLRFRLFDEFGRLLDLNGLDWSMAMVFDQLYD